ncbi:MAG: HD domain-containing protein [Patescibacteria group bacterium]
MIEEEILKEIAAREHFVISQFERVGLDIRRYPELFDRLKQLHGPESKHFEDAVQMVEIIEEIWEELDKQLPFKLEKEKMILATLLHDVGKSGPKEATSEEQKLIVTLFDPTHYERIVAAGKNVAEETILRALRDSDLEDGAQRKIAKYLNSLGIDISSEKMIDFWRRHADWTYDILKDLEGEKIDDRLAVMAASHHILDGKNPAGINLEQIPEEARTIEIIETYEVLTIVDKFQAFIKRSGLDHAAAIKILRSIIINQKFPKRVEESYLAILTVIENSKDKLQAKLKK